MIFCLEIKKRSVHLKLMYEALYSERSLWHLDIVSLWQTELKRSSTTKEHIMRNLHSIKLKLMEKIFIKLQTFFSIWDKRCTIVHKYVLALAFFCLLYLFSCLLTQQWEHISSRMRKNSHNIWLGTNSLIIYVTMSKVWLYFLNVKSFYIEMQDFWH